MNYYNEFDTNAAEWLRMLIEYNVIAPGDVDSRSIAEVQPSELRGYTQCHFFAGVGIWSYALRLAGWPDNRPVWTGSCPCQGFSAAGKGLGFDDPRHLWPVWGHLIAQCRPSIVFGEQVANSIKFGWLDLVQSEMESLGYAFASSVLSAASLGAPHIRKRLYFGAHAEHPERRTERRDSAIGNGSQPEQPGLERQSGHGRDWRGPGWLRPESARSVAETGATRGHWGDCDWWFGRDGKYRPIGTGIHPLVRSAKRSIQPVADGITADLRLLCDSGVASITELESAEARVMRLKGYGNAIVAQCAEAFIRSFVEAIPDSSGPR
jgi:DNA (cytosine-5)-methyltransferase 1